VSTHSEEAQAIYGGRIIGAKIRAQAAQKAMRGADRAETERPWSTEMKGYGALADHRPMPQ
jgi:hypothetical protein